MRFNTVIIGGGLSGLTTGIKLAESGQRVCIVSLGQSTLHFFSGSFDLLGYGKNFEIIDEPLKAIASLAPEHPYSRIGAEKVAALAAEAKALLIRAGIKVEGDAEQNHRRTSPLGTECPAWLTMKEGWLLPPTEGMKLKVPTEAGKAVQSRLRERFEALGGRFLLGDKVVGGEIADGRCLGVSTENLEDDVLRAENYVLATGSFMSMGLVANYEKVYEPIFDLDVEAVQDHTAWTVEDVFAPQPYMEIGVKTDAEWHVLKGGKAVSNMYAQGSILPGHNAVHQGDGTGVSMISALNVAHHIINRKS